MILCSAELRIISCLLTHVINLVINDNSLEIIYIYYIYIIYIYIVYIYIYIYIYYKLDISVSDRLLPELAWL